MEKEIERQLINAVFNKIKTSNNIIFNISSLREENQNTLLELGYTNSNVEQIIYELRADDCISSFKQDKDGYDGYVFEFGKEIEKKDIYIKFRVLF